ncbi:signal peptidase II [Sphaerotilus hippei]|uniref:Lipoprotein signal peptidase n=1 Tax=Sphaerotilus hippei TaxID=744406 RepID=A0A318HCH5_9BURK|nr:signal peptidase II [Sphaerotilus hippei]PXW96981.1 signal peptidase II [Sphaerotilus hippei]
MTPVSVGLVEPGAVTAASRGRWWLLMGVAGLLLVLDQGVKWVVAANLPLGDVLTVTAWFNLVHVLNPGASFSFLADAGGWQRHALTAFGAAVSVALAVLLWRGVRSRLETAAYVGLIGGALGNVVDRLRIGAVVDYLDLHWRGMHWPAFNLADIVIVGSAVLLVLASFGTETAARGTDRGDGT